MGDLAILGLRAEQEEVYRFLINRPGRTLAEIGAAVQAGRPAETVADLLCKGLVTRTAQTPPTFVAADPGIALGTLIAERENELRAVREAAGALLDRFHKMHGRCAPPRLVEVVTGADAVWMQAAQLTRHARRQVRVLGPAPCPRELSALADRDVACRSVRVQGQGHDFAGQVRIATTLPTSLLLYDDRFAMLLLGQASALLVHPSTLLDALSALFEAIWQRSRPLNREQPTAEDLRLLRLMSTGAKDEALARRLGLSARTVHRRIQKLMIRLGVSTRLQLGVEAAQRGWLTAQQPAPETSGLPARPPEAVRNRCAEQK